MKIILVISEDNVAFAPLVYPPLGLLYIAAVLEREFGDVSIFDMRDSDQDIRHIPKADVYCFSACTSQINAAISYAAYVKKTFWAWTVIGGPHVSWETKLVQNWFDAVIIGEGEAVIVDCIKNKRNGIFNAESFSPVDVNAIPFPARHLLPREKIVTRELWGGYRYTDDNHPFATTIVTSRGCPYKCAFCANIPQKIRFRDPENVRREIEEIIEIYDCKHFRFLDDNFILNRDRLHKLADILSPLHISFRCSARSDLLDSEVCNQLKKAGCEEIGFGVESGDDEVLEIIQKREKRRHHIQAIQLAKSYGLKTKVFLMAGLPGETWNSIEKTKTLMQEAKPDKWILTLFTPFPGSPIARSPDSFKIVVKKSDYSQYIQTNPTRSIICSKDADSDELTEHYNYLYQYLEQSYSPDC